jgi:putative ABC transport system permease protein
VLRTAIKTLLARKLRLLTTSLAVLLGVAFMSGTLVLTDTVARTFDELFADVFDDTDALVRGVTEVESTQFGDQRQRIDAGLLQTVAGAPTVERAVGFVQGYAQVVGKDGKPVGQPGQGPPTFGSSWIDDDELNSFTVTEGRAPQAAGEVVLDKGAATKGELTVGDRTKVLTQKTPVDVTVVGLAKFGEADSPGGATFVMFTTEQAQQLVGEPGKFDSILVVGEDGRSQDDIRDAIQSVLPPRVEALTGAEVTEENQSTIKQALSFFNYFLLAFALIAVFVGAFIIYNTFSIIVAQRGREMALMRAIGASRRQVLLSVLFEAAIVGLIAAVLGLVAGIGVAAALKAMLAAFGIDIPAGGIVLLPRTILVSLVVGVLVSVASAFFPALRASRVPPIAAMRDLALDRSGRSRKRIVIGALVTLLGAANVAYGLSGDAPQPLVSAGLGAALIFIGVAVLGPITAGPVSRLLGAPLPRFRGISGTLARENAMRNPARTSSTAAALMIGVGVVTFFTIAAASIKASVNDSVDNAFSGDFVISTKAFGFGGLSPELAEQLRGLPEVRAASGGRLAPVQIGTAQKAVFAVDRTTFGEIVDVGERDGRLADLGAGTIGLHDDVATDKNLKVGDQLAVKFGGSGEQQLRVAAVYEKNDVVGDYVIGLETYEANIADQYDALVLVDKRDEVPAAQARAAIDRLAAAYPTAEVLDQTEYKESVAGDVDQLLNMIYVLLALAVIIALMGIANTLALSIFERTRELGLLRAVGMSRSQLRSTVRWESVIIALFGTILGLGIGLFLGWALVKALADEGITTLDIPFARLVAVAVIAAIAGIIAAIRPARRAAKLDVLKAIATA